MNRAQAQLKLHHCEGALHDCHDILKNDANNIKALYRSVKALYGLENYDEALVQVKKLLKLDPNNADGLRELSAIVMRIKEKGQGLYNFNQMIEEANKSSTPRLDNASYVGPVQITEVSYTEMVYKNFILILHLLILSFISEVRVEQSL